LPEPQHACVAPGMLHDCVAELPPLPLPLPPLPPDAPLPPADDGPDDLGKQASANETRIKPNKR
jgi:hypothetical protein